MKSNVVILSLLALVSSCSSLESVKKNPNCVVWKDQKYLGPYSTEVVEKKVSWNTYCKGVQWNCARVDVSVDENNNIFVKDTTNVGKIENNEFKYSETEAPLITYTSLRAYPDAREIKASITSDVTTETTYYYNEKCSVPEGIVGAIALGLIDQAQKARNK